MSTRTRLRSTDRPGRGGEHRVAILVYDRPALFELSVAMEVWGLDRSVQGVPTSEVRVCSAEGPELSISPGFGFRVDRGLDTLAWADTIVIPSAPYPLDERDFHHEVLDGLRAAHERGARIATFCSGAFVLAATGLLDGRRATTHWFHAHTFRRRFPDVELATDVLYVDGGDRLFTSAGTAAAIDLCLHLVRQDWGAEVANTIARRMVVPPHRDGGQAQFIEQPMPTCDEVDADLRATLEWVRAHLDRPLTVEELARRAAMTPRTFARRFKASTGTTPLQWILHQRVAAAQRMLETTTITVDGIAESCGFGSAAALRQHFTKIVGSTPSAYRATFRHAA